MAIVVVVREFEGPEDPAQLQAREDEKGWCLEENGVVFVRSFVALDRTRMLCLYQAPDAEAVRRIHDVTQVPYSRIWAARSYLEHTGETAADPGSAGAVVVCERTYRQPIPIDRLSSKTENSRWCFDLHRVSLIESYIPADDMGSICVFAAPDAESVRKANEKAELPFSRVWASQLMEP